MTANQLTKGTCRSKEAGHLKSQAPKHRMLIRKKKKTCRNKEVDNLLD